MLCYWITKFTKKTSISAILLLKNIFIQYRLTMILNLNTNIKFSIFIETNFNRYWWSIYISCLNRIYRDKSTKVLDKKIRNYDKSAAQCTLFFSAEIMFSTSSTLNHNYIKIGGIQYWNKLRALIHVKSSFYSNYRASNIILNYLQFIAKIRT